MYWCGRSWRQPWFRLKNHCPQTSDASSKTSQVKHAMKLLNQKTVSNHFWYLRNDIGQSKVRDGA